MNAITTAFKPCYFAGETAKITVTADESSSVRVVYGGSELALTGSNGVFSGAISTVNLIGRVKYTVFVTNSAGDVSAIGNGSFTVRCAGRSPLRDVIDKIDEAIKTWGTNPNRSLQVGEISISYKSLDELLAVRAQYVQRADEQESGSVLTGGLRVVEVTF